MKNYFSRNHGQARCQSNGELHPQVESAGTTSFCAANDIFTIEAWSPLMQGKNLKEPSLTRNRERIIIAQSPRIVLRWDIQHEIIVLTKSVKTERLISNAALFDFELMQKQRCK